MNIFKNLRQKHCTHEYALDRADIARLDGNIFRVKAACMKCGQFYDGYMECDLTDDDIRRMKEHNRAIREKAGV